MIQKLRKIVKDYIGSLISEIDASTLYGANQTELGKRIMGDNSIVIINKIKLGEKLTTEEMSEAREKYLNEYISAKVGSDNYQKKTNPINAQDLEAIFEKNEFVLDNYLKSLVNKYSNVEQISDLERASLLNLDMYQIPYGSNNNIAKKYIIKMLYNIDVPQKNDNKWIKNDSAEIWKAYNISMSDEKFRDDVMQILAKRGKHNSALYKKLKQLKERDPNDLETFE
jgi:hypothetical protein